MPSDSFINGFLTKWGELAPQKRQVLSNVEANERMVATRVGQGIGLAIGVRAARAPARRALVGLKSSGRLLGKTRLKGIGAGIKALALVAGTTTSGGLSGLGAATKAQSWRRNRLEGVPVTPISARVKKIKTMAATELSQAATLPRSYGQLSRRD